MQCLQRAMVLPQLSGSLTETRTCVQTYIISSRLLTTVGTARFHVKLFLLLIPPKILLLWISEGVRYKTNHVSPYGKPSGQSVFLRDRTKEPSLEWWNKSPKNNKKRACDVSLRTSSFLFRRIQTRRYANVCLLRSNKRRPSSVCLPPA